MVLVLTWQLSKPMLSGGVCHWCSRDMLTTAVQSCSNTRSVMALLGYFMQAPGFSACSRVCESAQDKEYHEFVHAAVHHAVSASILCPAVC